MTLSLCSCTTYHWLEDDNNDPFQGVNRAVFKLNKGVDTVLVKPAAKGYRFAVPKVARKGIHNALLNLKSPAIFANDLMQGEVKKSGVTLSRFALNTTVGLLGTFDVAEKLGLKYHNEDFGQTLATWGVGEGPYIVLPLLGPSNPRDAIGKVVDVIINPFDLYPYVTDADKDTVTAINYAKTGLSVLDARERSLELLDDLEDGSIDFYTAVRSMYRQNRKNAIHNAKDNVKDIAPDAYDFSFDDDFEDE
jgi:phospholipid-binding lipoprotein MlaA